MKHAFKTLVGAAAVASIVVAAGTASAADTNSKCHQTIAKNITKYQAALAKNIIGCHKSRTGQKIASSTDCNVTNVNSGGSDLKGKRSASRQKAIDGIAKACNGGLGDTAIAQYVACPSPFAGPITNSAELANCLLNLSESYMSDIGEQLMGLPASPATLSDAAVDCQGAIGKALSKAVKTVGGSRAKCNAGKEKTAGMVYAYDTTCSTGDPDGKIGPALAGISNAINQVCNANAEADYAALGNCAATLNPAKSDVNQADLLACGFTKIAAPIINGLAGAALELPGTCAATADVTINAGRGLKTTATRLDSGWKGVAHEVDVVDQSIGAVSLSGCDSDCKNCDVTHNPKNGNCRCENDPTIECSTIEGVGGPCGGANLCHCMFGPPLALSASGSPVCVVNRFAEEFSGTTGEVGEYDVATRTKALVHLGIAQTQPCPTCDGDTTANDGNRNGTCDGGPRDGLSCDTNALSDTFGDTSFDCPPDSGGNISGSGLDLSLSFSSGSASLSANVPSAAAWCDGTTNCHCSICTGAGNQIIGCSTDSDCPLGETCGAISGAATNPKQNNCTGSCVPEVDGTGTCDGAMDILTTCGGFLNGFGNGIIPCDDDADCDANDCNGDGMATAGECGACDLQDYAKCFPPTITADGDPGIYTSNGVSVFCSGVTTNSGVNNAGGLPGAGRVKLNFDFDLYCSDNTTRFQLPEGSNCP